MVLAVLSPMNLIILYQGKIMIRLANEYTFVAAEKLARELYKILREASIYIDDSWSHTFVVREPYQQTLHYPTEH